MFEKTFFLGESKWIDVEVRSKDKCNVIVIPFSWYELFYINDEIIDIKPEILSSKMSENFVLEASGGCTIKENTVSALITPKQNGLYLLKIIYTVADETRIVMVKINVY